jgi:glycosyltransferase involved in cell wall biosynthesis
VHEEASFLCWPLLLAGPKLVYDMHSSLPNQLVAYRWQRFPLLVPLLRRYERFCLRRADAVITISPGLARHARALVANPDRHLLIENSIFDPIRTRRSPDPDQASRWLARVPEGRVIVAYTGTFEPYQGLDLLIEATALARRRDPRLFLLLVGGEPSQVESHQALAARAGLHEHSLFTGPFDQASVEVILERAQVLASPRKDGTSTPLKLYRWLASGRPIVATRIRAHTDVLDDAVSFLADPDPRAFAEGLLAAARGDQESRRRTEAALEVYRSRYSRPSYVAKMQELLGLLGL